MDHGLMMGMFWGGVLLMSVPVLTGIGIGLYVLHRYRAGRLSRPDGESAD